MSESESCSVVSDFLQPHGLYPARLLCPWILQATILEWITILFSRGCSRSKNWAWVSRTADRFFSMGLPHCGQILYHLSHRRSWDDEWMVLNGLGLESKKNVPMDYYVGFPGPLQTWPDSVWLLSNGGKTKLLLWPNEAAMSVNKGHMKPVQVRVSCTDVTYAEKQEESGPVSLAPRTLPPWHHLLWKLPVHSSSYLVASYSGPWAELDDQLDTGPTFPEVPALLLGVGLSISLQDEKHWTLDWPQDPCLPTLHQSHPEPPGHEGEAAAPRISSGEHGHMEATGSHQAHTMLACCIVWPRQGPPWRSRLPRGAVCCCLWLPPNAGPCGVLLGKWELLFSASGFSQWFPLS